MMIKVIKFAFKGIELNTHTTVPFDEVKKRLKRYSFTKAIFGKTERVVARARNENVTMYRLGVPLLIMGKPVLYTRMVSDETGTLISGKFTFSIFSRVVFWLGHIGVFVLFGIGIFRMIIAQSQNEPMLWYIRGSFAVLIGGMLGFLIYSWYSWTWQNRRDDMKMLAESLKLVLTTIVPEDNNKPQ